MLEADALKAPNSPLAQLAGDWRQLLFPDATDAQFADAYAQTVAFALLLGRSEGRTRSRSKARCRPSMSSTTCCRGPCKF